MQSSELTHPNISYSLGKYFAFFEVEIRFDAMLCVCVFERVCVNTTIHTRSHLPYPNPLTLNPAPLLLESMSGKHSHTHCHTNAHRQSQVASEAERWAHHQCGCCFGVRVECCWGQRRQQRRLEFASRPICRMIVKQKPNIRQRHTKLNVYQQHGSRILFD